MPRLLLPVALAGALLCAGCDTFAHRVRQQAAFFATLTPAQRDQLQHGVVKIGDTPDMVYLALGVPDEKNEKATAHGAEEDWVYYSYHQEYAGNVVTGYNRVLLYDSAHKRYDVVLDPIHKDVFSETTEDNIRVTFKDGRVAVIEQPKPPAP